MNKLKIASLALIALTSRAAPMSPRPTPQLIPNVQRLACPIINKTQQFGLGTS